MFCDWSNALNNTQHLEKQRKCSVAQYLFSEEFDRDQTSLNKTQQGRTRLKKVVKRSEHFALNKCSMLFSEMFSTFDRGLKVAVGPKPWTNRNLKQTISTDCRKTAIFQLLLPLDISKLVGRQLTQYFITEWIYF